MGDSTKLIYIPIWLYSNHYPVIPPGFHHQFTFQSGYIQIDIADLISKVTKVFTFQSGYIQIPMGSNKLLSII